MTNSCCFCVPERVSFSAKGNGGDALKRARGHCDYMSKPDHELTSSDRKKTTAGCQVSCSPSSLNYMKSLNRFACAATASVSVSDE